MDKSLHLDLNLDKHLDTTLVIECPVCGHEITHHFRSLEPDSVLVCSQCQHSVTVSEADLERAEVLYQAMLRDGEQ
ncbi:MAG: hypothetical protein KBE25_01865 [Laribacter sp.]|nr:hypothetical protein [Laribacter sp.]MBP9608086.1 hypothetical protein [Laribacter sp.]